MPAWTNAEICASPVSLEASDHVVVPFGDSVSDPLAAVGLVTLICGPRARTVAAPAPLHVTEPSAAVVTAVPSTVMLASAAGRVTRLPAGWRSGTSNISLPVA